MAFDTSLNILNKAAKRVGIATSDSADPYGETDQNWVQLRNLLEELGEELLRKHAWSHLQKTHTFNTADGTASYALPTDFHRLIDQTEWNRTQDLPLGGPVSPQGWQLLQALSSSLSVTQLFRIYGNLVYIHPTPSAIESVAFEYQSRYWVKESGQGDPNTESADAKEDTLHFDSHLLVTGLQFKFLAAKGFPVGETQRNYEDALAACLGGDGAAPVLRIDGAGMRINRLLDSNNMPDTGYGS
jgi:hypothetical protein